MKVCISFTEYAVKTDDVVSSLTLQHCKSYIHERQNEDCDFTSFTPYTCLGEVVFALIGNYAAMLLTRAAMLK